MMVGHRCVPLSRSWDRRNPTFETFLTIPHSHRSDRWITNNLRFSLGGWAHVPPHCLPIHRPSTGPFVSFEGSPERSFRDLSNDASLVSFAPFFVLQFRFFRHPPPTLTPCPCPTDPMISHRPSILSARVWDRLKGLFEAFLTIPASFSHLQRFPHNLLFFPAPVLPPPPPPPFTPLFFPPSPTK